MTFATPSKDVVLVVDDSPESLGMINDTLDTAGLTVLVALEGNQALSIANSITPDIILMDAIMPNLDGFETCRLFKSQSHLAHIPVIFMTGLSDAESVVKGFEAGGVDYVQKPVNSDELIARMKVHLHNARLTQSARLALDSAGQYLFATSREGKIKWATPQAHQLFISAGLSEEWLDNALPSVIQTLLSEHYNRDRGIKITEGNKALAVRYISMNESDEYLLRLVDLERPSDTHILQKTYQLTAREAEVLMWLARGKSNSEIAMILNISPRTINKHLEQIFRKLMVENRTSAAIKTLKTLETSGAQQN
jgi:DNA-binding NarL/FixJ family response regulator